MMEIKYYIDLIGYFTMYLDSVFVCLADRMFSIPFIASLSIPIFIIQSAQAFITQCLYQRLICGSSLAGDYGKGPLSTIISFIPRTRLLLMSPISTTQATPSPSSKQASPSTPASHPHPRLTLSSLRSSTCATIRQGA
jgi:hypothetical protein